MLLYIIIESNYWSAAHRHQGNAPANSPLWTGLLFEKVEILFEWVGLQRMQIRKMANRLQNIGLLLINHFFHKCTCLCIVYFRPNRVQKGQKQPFWAILGSGGSKLVEQSRTRVEQVMAHAG